MAKVDNQLAVHRAGAKHCGSNTIESLRENTESYRQTPTKHLNKIRMLFSDSFDGESSVVTNYRNLAG